jgi:hypothetical protein
MFRILRPLALLAATTTLLPRTHHCNDKPSPMPEKRTKLAEVKRDRMMGEDYPILRLTVIVVKRYYLGIMRASMKAWL